MALSKARTRLTVCLPNIVFIICIIQPLLDVISFWSPKLGMPNALTLGIRLLMMAAIVITAFIITDKKRVYLIMVGILLLLSAAHIYACNLQGYSDMIGDLTNLVRIYHFPILTLCFITFLKKDPDVYRSILKGFVCVFLIILAVRFLSVATSTEPYTYPNKKLGFLGWFYFANTQSGIISVLSTIYVFHAITKNKGNPVLMVLNIFIAMASLFLFATRLTYAALLMIGVGTVITLIITDRKNIRAIISVSLITVLFVALFPISPMYRNQKQFSQNRDREQEKIEELAAEYEAKALEQGLEGEELKIARLEGVYLEHLPGLVERFGLERTVKHYNYTEDAEKLYNFREMKLSYNALLTEEYGITAKLFGVELADLTSAGVIHDVENDFHGIYYLCGGVGLILLILFIGYFVILTFKALIIDFKGMFNLESAAWGMAFIAMLMHVYATAGVLRRPNGSFYLSVILAVIFYLTKIRSASNHTERKSK